MKTLMNKLRGRGKSWRTWNDFRILPYLALIFILRTTAPLGKWIQVYVASTPRRHSHPPPPPRLLSRTQGWIYMQLVKKNQKYTFYRGKVGWQICSAILRNTLLPFVALKSSRDPKWEAVTGREGTVSQGVSADKRVTCLWAGQLMLWQGRQASMRCREGAFWYRAYWSRINLWFAVV